MKTPSRVPLLMLALLAVLSGGGRLLASPAERPSVDPSLFREMRWRSIGPFRGGRVLAVAGVRGQADVFYFGAVGGGVWRTNDAGRTWKPTFDAQPIASIGALAVAPSNPSVIYAGSGEADMRSDISYGNGIYKSEDGGKTWSHMGLGDTRQIARIVVDPQDANTVYVAALGHAYGPNAERGVFRSTDGGKSWQRVLFHDENTGAIDLALDPHNPKTVYAALLQTRRPPWNVYPPSKGPGSGLYRSSDGGSHWERLSGHGLPSEGLGRMGIAIAPSNPRRVYLIADAKEGGLYRSEDGGENWTRVSADKRIWGRGWYFCEVIADPKDAETVYVPNTSLYRSQDGGKTFTAIKGAPGGDDYHSLWIDPEEPRRMILGSDQGAVVTRNGGETWSSWYNQPTGQFYHVATDNRFPYWVYGAQQDSGPAGTPSRGRYRALNFHDWRPLEAGEENGYLAPDPLHPGIVYGGFVSRQDLRTEQNQQMPPTLAYSGEYRRTWTLPLVFSPVDPHVLYFGSQALFRTSDEGNTWRIISPDLTREDPGVPGNLDPPAAADAPEGKRRGVIYTIGVSAVSAGEIWAGTDDGLIQVTRDEGKTWSNVTPAEIGAWSKVTHIEASHFDAGTAYAAVDRHRLDDLQAYLYRTRDFGKSWQRISRGIPEGSFLNCVREDPARKGLLYACTETGVFVSFDDGENWQALQQNLPATSVRDLVVHGDDVVIATHGRGFWVLDNVTPLRQINAQAAAADAWLFRPQTAYRVRPGTDQGSPVPFDEALAENPPGGALLDYFLKEKPATPVQLEIFDAQGNLARRYASDDELPRTNPGEINVPMYWIHDAEPLSAEAGMHRFVWDLKYPLPAGVHSSFYGPFGPWALPGAYTVKLTVNGKSMTQALVVEMDPRVKTAQADLAREFQASSKLAADLGGVSAAIRQADDLQKRIAALGAKAAGEKVLTEPLAALDAQIRALAGSGEQGEGGLFSLDTRGTARTTLRQVAMALQRLLSITESADAAPTADALTAIAGWDAARRETLARWEGMRTQDVARINGLLRKAHVEPLPEPGAPAKP
ncbi:MAG: hypothetical protein LAN84_13965 [Acidobacteriia bacterium]|nr:hypothetical protein [Terriglobia bacterium]